MKNRNISGERKKRVQNGIFALLCLALILSLFERKKKFKRDDAFVCVSQMIKARLLLIPLITTGLIKGTNFVHKKDMLQQCGLPFKIRYDSPLLCPNKSKQFFKTLLFLNSFFSAVVYREFSTPERVSQGVKILCLTMKRKKFSTFPSPSPLSHF